jgi:deoxyadenosine/deoxycytidine kinase
MDKIQILTSLASAIIGGVIATYLKAFLEKRKEIEINLQKITEDKYRSLLIFMACAIDFNKRRFFSLNEQVENKSAEDYLNQIKEYYYHSILYSPDKVIIALKEFINNPNKLNYAKVAQEMRKDLWNKNTKLSFEQILL